MIQSRYNQILDENYIKIPKTDSIISDCIDKIIDIHMDITKQEYCDGQDISCREVVILVLIMYKYHKSVISSTYDTEKYVSMHTIFLKPLFRHHVFRNHIVNPLVMRCVFMCTINSTIPELSDAVLEGQLDMFYGAILKEGRKLYSGFLKERAKQTAIFKEDLIAAAWHPRRVEKWLEIGGFELLDTL